MQFNKKKNIYILTDLKKINMHEIYQLFILIEEIILNYSILIVL